MRRFRAQSTLRLMAALLVLVMGVIGPVQASVHAGGMAGHAALVEAVGSMLTDPPSAHAVHHHSNEHIALPAASHSGVDSPCVELCLLMSLAPSVGAEFDRPETTPARIADAGVPVGQAQPTTPPPKFLI